MKKKIFLLAIFLSACNIFSTRTPEEPEGSVHSSVFLPQTSVENLLSNFKNSVKYGDAQYFRQCLADSNYVFVPANAAQLGDQFANWSPQREETAFRYLVNTFGKNDTLNLILSGNLTATPLDTVFYSSPYQLKKIFHDSVVAAGTLNLTMKRQQNTNKWVIQRWEDVSVAHDTIRSWTDIKAIAR